MLLDSIMLDDTRNAKSVRYCFIMCINPIVLMRNFGDKGKFSSYEFGEYKNNCEKIVVGCGKCVECKHKRKSEWTYRALLELESFNNVGCMITLTYNDDFNPVSVQSKQLQDFLKRLRKQIKIKIKFIGCSEYGKLHDRPHYHLAIFGYDFPDKIFFGKDKKGSILFRSPLLEKCWKFGYSSICELNENTLAYVVKYMQKFDEKKDYESQGLIAPFFRCSQGIGKLKFLEKHIINDFDYVNGKEFYIPRYLLEKLDNYDDLKRKREKAGRETLINWQDTKSKNTEKIHLINRKNRINRK